MKKTLAIILALCLGASMLAACGGSGSSAPASASVAGSTGSSAPEAKPVEIRVVTSYGEQSVRFFKCFLGYRSRSSGWYDHRQDHRDLYLC